MIIATAFFYLFACIAVASGFMVVAARNPVHSVLFLILAFFNAAGLFMLMGAEFLALALIYVYVGAVAVLFLFVVMMLDIDFRALRRNVLQYLPIGALIGLIVLAELVLVAGSWVISPQAPKLAATPIAPLVKVTNTDALGRVLYTDYIYFFQIAGLIMLVAMVSAIVLTLRHKPHVRRQKIAEQVARPMSVALHKMRPGQGV